MKYRCSLSGRCPKDDSQKNTPLEILWNLSTKHFSVVEGLFWLNSFQWSTHLLPLAHTVLLREYQQDSPCFCDVYLTFEGKHAFLSIRHYRACVAPPPSFLSLHYLSSVLSLAQTVIEFGCLRRHPGKEWKVYPP